MAPPRALTAGEAMLPMAELPVKAQSLAVSRPELKMAPPFPLEPLAKARWRAVKVTLELTEIRPTSFEPLRVTWWPHSASGAPHDRQVCRTCGWLRAAVASILLLSWGG